MVSRKPTYSIRPSTLFPDSAVSVSSSGCLPASLFSTVVAKFGSLPSASASSFSVSSVSGAEPTNCATFAATNAAVAISIPAAAVSGVGAVGVPVSAGLSSGALVCTSSMTAWTAFGVAASASLSLSVALLNLTIPFFVRLASSREITSAISSARFAASSALVAPAPANENLPLASSGQM
ncbi:Uncharacterised protein [Salmonella enterica subsp. enterica serovar Typhimurium str. DT104]|nr:Uncharacterised protein [Salmonella enterica subsp. enterica serovar Typhimurium str. DT104]